MRLLRTRRWRRASARSSRMCGPDKACTGCWCGGEPAAALRSRMPRRRGSRRAGTDFAATRLRSDGKEHAVSPSFSFIFLLRWDWASTLPGETASSRQPCLAIGLHRLFQIASFGGKDALHGKTALFQAIGERRVFARILFDKRAVDFDHTLREVEIGKVVNALALRDLPDAPTLIHPVIRSAMLWRSSKTVCISSPLQLVAAPGHAEARWLRPLRTLINVGSVPSAIR